MKYSVTFISDTHNTHYLLDLPGGDFLIHSGDVSGNGTFVEVESFLKWFDKQPYKYKVFISGNHDFFFDHEWKSLTPKGSSRHTHDVKTYDEIKELIAKYPTITYLEDSAITLDGLKLYGTPWQPWFHDWAFNADEEKRKEVFCKIPEGIDILISHGPPHNILDRTAGNMIVGCKELFINCMRVKPLVHVFGHIHEEYGYKEFNDIHFINASVLDLKYHQINKPVNCVIDTEDRTIDFI